MTELPDPEKIIMPSWSIVLFIIAGCLMLGALVGLLGNPANYMGSIISSFVAAAIFVALGRILDYANEIVIRLRRMQEQEKAPDQP